MRMIVRMTVRMIVISVIVMLCNGIAVRVENMCLLLLSENKFITISSSSSLVSWVLSHLEVGWFEYL